ncbi:MULTISPECIES: hypothetical protein [Bacteria]|uniref:hypothetical protein n=1 Tax=Bacteria TaxID=2 RepID=UPI002E7AE736|nr:hypothetical protein [Cetobacterium somerae]WVJ03056.1 hypothetical protein VSU16_15100 [Cetobacterium somerae]
MSFLIHLPDYLKQVMLKQLIVKRSKLIEEFKIATGSEKEEIENKILEKNTRIDRIKINLEKKNKY